MKTLTRLFHRDPQTQGPQAQIAADWSTHVACPGGPLPGAKLTLPERTRFGWAFTVELKPGWQPIVGVGVDV